MPSRAVRGPATPRVDRNAALWERVDTVTVEGGTLVVELSDRGGASSQRVLADAIRVQRIVGDGGAHDDFHRAWRPATAPTTTSGCARIRRRSTAPTPTSRASPTSRIARARTIRARTGLTPTVGISAGNGFTFVLAPIYDGAAMLAGANSLEWAQTPGFVYYDIGAYEFQGDSNDATPPVVTLVTNLPPDGGTGGDDYVRFFTIDGSGHCAPVRA